MLEIIRVTPGEIAKLKEIAIASKGYWGYPEPLMAQWAQTSIISAEAVTKTLVYKACVDGTITGWYRLIPQASPPTLEDLWVLPAFMNKGIGRALFQHAVEQASRHGAQGFELDTDPNAVSFYQKMGCEVIGESLSEWGRNIPHMRYSP